VTLWLFRVELGQERAILSACSLTATSALMGVTEVDGHKDSGAVRIVGIERETVERRARRHAVAFAFGYVSCSLLLPARWFL